jgi:hypothetical protein
MGVELLVSVALFSDMPTLNLSGLCKTITAYRAQALQTPVHNKLYLFLYSLFDSSNAYAVGMRIAR